MKQYNLVIIRHGQSLWNQENRFTGWKDIDLSSQGMSEARRAADTLKKYNFFCDLACTSVLKRAIRTLWIVLEETDQMWVPVIKSWRLNERHYGQLTGLNKSETVQKYGKEQVQLWRRDYTTVPPLLSDTDSLDLKDLRYQQVDKVPQGESLEQTKKRVIPFWQSTVVPAVQSGKKVLIVAHGNSLRALIKHIERLNDKEITGVEVPTGTPMAYELSKEDLSIKTARTAL